MHRDICMCHVTYQYSCGCCWPTCDLHCTRSSMNLGCSHICACNNESGSIRLCLPENTSDRGHVPSLNYNRPIRLDSCNASDGLTYTVFSTPLVALRTLTGVRALGVDACLLRATRVPSGRTLIDVYNETYTVHM